MWAVSSAPEWRVLYIVRSKPLHESFYDPLIQAVTWVESKWGKYIWNNTERAVGWFQIRQVRVDDYNQRTGSHYKLNDFFDYELSEKMFLYYAQGKSFERASKDWNGSGKKTLEYWRKIQQVL